MLSRAERWVSRSVVNRADARGGIWDVEVVEAIIGRPLHHTLLIVESQQAVPSVVQCPPPFIPPPLNPAQATRRAEEIMAVDLTVLGVGRMGIEGVFFDSSGKYGIFERVEASSLGSLNCRMALWSI